MLSKVNLWEAEDFHCLWFNTSVWSVLKLHSTLFSPITETRLSWTKSVLRSERVQRDSRPEKGKLSSTVTEWIPHENYESRSTVMRDKMSDTKVHVTDEQPWVAERGGNSTSPTTPKCTQVGTKMFTWSTTPMSRTRHESRNIERGDTERKDNKGKGGGKQRGKKEKGGENRGREKVKMCQVWKPKEKRTENKQKNPTDFLYWGRKKILQHIKAKAQHKRENCWLDGDSVEGEWEML